MHSDNGVERIIRQYWAPVLIGLMDISGLVMISLRLGTDLVDRRNGKAMLLAWLFGRAINLGGLLALIANHPS